MFYFYWLLLIAYTDMQNLQSTSKSFVSSVEIEVNGNISDSPFRPKLQSLLVDAAGSPRKESVRLPLCIQRIKSESEPRQKVNNERLLPHNLLIQSTELIPDVSNLFPETLPHFPQLKLVVAERDVKETSLPLACSIICYPFVFLGFAGFCSTSKTCSIGLSRDNTETNKSSGSIILPSTFLNMIISLHPYTSSPKTSFSTSLSK